MISSMTGFGRGQRERDQWATRAEVRSVNRKELQLSLRLPEAFNLKEGDLRKLVAERIHRGHVHLSVSCEPSSEAQSVVVDERRVGQYLRALRQVAEKQDLPVQVDLGSLLRLPGALKDLAADEELRDSLWDDVVGAVCEALDGLVQMRRTEGENLAEQLEGLCEDLSRLTDEIERAQEEFVVAYRDRLRQRIDRLLEGTGVEVEEQALAREVAFQAERSDVSEEITRLRSHVEQFKEALGGPAEPVGRKMEFIGQEMLREASTMGAKVPAGPQVEQVLELKTAIERLREQVRNVE